LRTTRHALADAHMAGLAAYRSSSHSSTRHIASSTADSMAALALLNSSSNCW
jgi:hypothetical protein